MTIQTDSRFLPGTFGCHEALHMASFLCDAVEEQLMEHDAIKGNPTYLAMATKAHGALLKLYQHIGKDHL